MKVVVCRTSADFEEFYKVPFLIYADDLEFVPHIREDIEYVLKPKSESDCVEQFILKNEGKTVGRAACFMKEGEERGGIGFFECIDNLKAAKLLFEHCELYLKEHGCQYVEAPVNFGERDKYWGLLIAGFKSPSYQENYNPEYYRNLFEANYYEVAFEQTTQEITPKEFNREQFDRQSEKLVNQGFHIEHFKSSNKNKYTRDFVEIYNKAWAIHEHFKPMTVEQVLSLMKRMRPVMREDLLWYTYHNEKPIAFYFSIIELNQIMKYMKGSLNWLGKLKFLYFRQRVKIKRVKGVIFGVVPEYQGKGVTSAMIMKVFDTIVRDKHLESTELAWIGDFNPRMMKFLKRLGAYETKRHATFRKKL